MFLCPKCKSELFDLKFPCTCGHLIQIKNGVYQMTNDSPICTDGELKWLGYENVGVNYEPGYALSYNDDFGIFGSCARKLAEILPANAVVLDLGAGLGQASIPLAAACVDTVAVDISQKMLAELVKRSDEHKIGDQKLIATRMNAYDLKFSDNSIDAVIEIDMLHQVDRPDLILRECKRVLKSNGVYVRFGCRGLPVTEEQHKANLECNIVESDIKNYYYSLLESYSIPCRPFESWTLAEEAVKKHLYHPKIIETEEIIDWCGDIDFRLHKLKTRASGGDQLIPDEIHNKAWRKTEDYAVKKYGVDYGKKKRYTKMQGYLMIYYPA